MDKVIRDTGTDHSGKNRSAAAGALPPDGFAARIVLLAREYGGVSRIAKLCGFSEGVVRSWRDGRSDPSRQRCLALARGLGISLLWLVSGEGAMRNKSAPAEPAVGEATAVMDTRRLSKAMRVLQSTLDGTGNELSLDSRADLLGEYYAVLGNPDPVARAEGVSEIHRHLVDRIREAKSSA